jgi:hypothetical protein
MAQYVFGTGEVYITPVGGGVPLKVGALQDVSVEFSSDSKQLYGQYQFALDVARGKSKIEGKASSGQMNAELWNQVFFGQEVSTGQRKQAINEAGTVPAMATYTVTVTNAADFYMDLGVYDALTGLPLTQVPAMPGDGQYSVSNAGVYTFNVAQAGDSMLFNYIYDDGAAGSTIELANLLMGATPKFQVVLSQTYQGKTITVVLYSCVSEKLSMPFKQDDYLVNEMDFQAQANDAGRIGFISVTG